MGKLIISRCSSLAAIVLVAGFLAASPAGARGSAAGGTVARRDMSHGSRLLSGRVVMQTPTMSSCPQGVSKQSGAHFQVWACKGTGATPAESAALAIAESEYTPMTDLMGAPLPDCTPRPACTAHGGGKINIYLLKPGQTLTRNGRTDGLGSNELGAEIDSAKAGPVSSSGYILLHREMVQADPATFRSVVVHEFFHVLTSQYNNSDDCLSSGKTYWFVEASAKWAESYFARPTAPDQVYPWFSDFQQNPDISLTDVVHRTSYADFIWPYFMQEKGGVLSITDAWRAMASARSCAQMTAAMNSVFSFADNFKNFAVENFDSQLVNPATGVEEWPQGFGDDYPDNMDNNFPEQEPTFSFLNTFTRPSTQSVPVKIPPLATVYEQIDTSKPAGALAINFSAIGQRSNLDIEGLITETSGKSGQHGQYPWKRFSISTNNLSVCGYPDVEDDVKMFLVLANHNMTSTVSGSYTVTAQTSCATAASATLTLTEHDIPYLTQTFGHITNTATLNLFWNQCPNCQGMTQDLTRGSGSWKITGSYPGFCGNSPGAVSGSGSYTGWGTKTGWSLAEPDSYWEYPDPFSAPSGFYIQAFTDPIIVTCPGGNKTELHNIYWPLPVCTFPPATQHPWEEGKWVDPEHTVLNLTCTATSSAGTTTVSGTASAIGVILCGAFTPNCPIDIPPYAGSPTRPRR